MIGQFWQTYNIFCRTRIRNSSFHTTTKHNLFDTFLGLQQFLRTTSVFEELIGKISLPPRDVPKQLRKSLTKVTPATLRPPFQILSKRLDKAIASLYVTAEVSAIGSLDARENKNNLVFFSGRLDKLDGELLRLGDLNLPHSVPQIKSDLQNLEDSLRRSIDTNSRKIDIRINDLESSLVEPCKLGIKEH